MLLRYCACIYNSFKTNNDFLRGYATRYFKPKLKHLRRNTSAKIEMSPLLQVPPTINCDEEHRKTVILKPRINRYLLFTSEETT